MKYNKVDKYNNIWEVLTESVEKRKDQDFLHYKHNYAKFHKTYGEFYVEVKKLASYIDSLGLKKGDKAIIYLPSRPEWLQIMFACALLGVILVPIDMDTKSEPISQIIRETNPRLIFQSNKKEISVDYDFENTLFVENFYETIDSYDQISPREYVKNIEPDDIFEILYTSGTTGKPKGVIITNKTITSNLYNALLVFPIQKEMKALQILPFSHSFALIISIGIFAVGGELSFVKDLTPEEIKIALHENEVHIIAAVPLFLTKIKDGIELKFKKLHLLPVLKSLMFVSSLIPSMELRRKLFSTIHKQLGGDLRMIVSAGSYLQPNIYNWWEKLGVKIIKGYGTTETGPVLSLDREESRDAQSIGYPIPNQQLKIVDNEILVKGDHVTPGYYKNPEKTQEAFTEDGWYKTGDFGYIEKEKLYYKGRQKNMIALPNGMNVYPEDIENIFNRLEIVNDVAIIGIDKDGKGDQIFGVFITESNKEDLEKAIIRVNKEELNPNQWVKDFVIWDGEDFPRTHTKKVKKNVLKDEVIKILNGQKKEDNKKNQDYKNNNEEKKKDSILYTILEDVTTISKDKMNEDLNLVSDLSLDSLSRADLLSQIEREYEKSVPEYMINPKTTIKDLRETIKNANKVEKTNKKIKTSTWASSFLPNLFRNFIAYPIWGIIFIFFVQIKVNGKIPKDKKQFLIISNHRSNLDGIIIAKKLPHWLRNKTYVTASGFHWDETWRKYFRAINQLFVLPIFTLHGKNGLDTMEKTAFYVNRGNSILIFPEGKLIYNDKKKNKFKKGAAKIIKEFHLPVLEYKVKGLDVIKPHMLLPTIGSNKVTIDIEYKEINPYKPLDEINSELEKDFEGY